MGKSAIKQAFLVKLWRYLVQTRSRIKAPGPDGRRRIPLVGHLKTQSGLWKHQLIPLQMTPIILSRFSRENAKSGKPESNEKRSANRRGKRSRTQRVYEGLGKGKGEIPIFCSRSSRRERNFAATAFIAMYMTQVWLTDFHSIRRTNFVESWGQYMNVTHKLAV